MSENIAKYNVLLELLAETKGIDDVEKKVGGLQRSFSAASKVAAGFVAGIGIAEIGQQIFQTTAKFQGYESVLKNTLGTQREADKALKLIKDTAKGTVFSVDELTSSYLKFANRGIKLTSAEIVKLADIAASQGKSFDQLTEAVLDAQTGEFERLKEFGIRASKSGDQITFAFKGVNTTIKNTPEAINALISSYGDLAGVQGANVSQMATLNGQLSNIGDTVDDLYVKIGNALLPVFNAVLSVVASLLAGFGTLFQILSQIPSFVVENAAAFKLLAVAVVSFNIPLAISTTALLSNIVATKAKAAADLFLANKTSILTRAQLLLNSAYLANPIGVIIAAVAVLSAGMVFLYNKSETVRNVFAGLANIGKTLASTFTSIGSSISTNFKDGFLTGLKNIGSTIIEYFANFAKETFSDFGNLINGEDVANSALRIGRKILAIATGGLSELFINAGKSLADSFTKGFDDNANIEARLKFKVAGRGNIEDIQANFKRLAEINKKAAEQEDIDNKKAAEKRKKNAEEAAKRSEENAKKDKELRDKQLESERESVDLRFALLEQKARKEIQDADDLARELQIIELNKQKAIKEVEQRFETKQSRLVELANEIDVINDKLAELFKPRETFDPLDFLSEKQVGEVKTQVEVLKGELGKLNELFLSVADPSVKAELAQRIEELKNQIKSFNSDSINKLVFENEGFDGIDPSKLAGKDQVSALKERISNISLIQKGFQDQLKNGTLDYSELLQSDKLDEEANKIIAILKRLGIEIPKISKETRDKSGDILGISAESLELTKQGVGVATDAFNQISDAYVTQLDKRLAIQEDRVKKAQDIAEKGNVKQLKLEEERLAKIQEEREKATTRQQALNKAAAQVQIILDTALAISSIKLAAARVAAETGVASPVTVPIVLAILAGLISTAANLYTPPNFIMGTEQVNKDPQFNKFKRHSGQDGYNANFDGRERIIDPAKNMAIGDLSNAQLVEAAQLYRNTWSMNPTVDYTKLQVSSTSDIGMKELKSELISIRESIENNKTSVKIDNKGIEVIVQKYFQRLSTTDRYKY